MVTKQLWNVIVCHCLFTAFWSVPRCCLRRQLSFVDTTIVPICNRACVFLHTHLKISVTQLIHAVESMCEFRDKCICLSQQIHRLNLRQDDKYLCLFQCKSFLLTFCIKKQTTDNSILLSEGVCVCRQTALWVLNYDETGSPTYVCEVNP